MLSTKRRRFAAYAIWCGVLIMGFALSLAGCDTQSPQQPRNASSQGQQQRPKSGDVRQRQVGESGEMTFMVDPGKEDEGFNYYFASFCELGLFKDTENTEPLCKADPPPSPQVKEESVTARRLDLTQALQFLGYDGLTPRELEDTASADLMSRFPGDLLSSAFFAPKITDVSQSLNDGGNTPINVGWRKLIRLKARNGSPAQQKGIASGFLLFNKSQGTDYNKSPFRTDDLSSESKATQLILVRTKTTPPNALLKRPVYFFVFGPLSGNSQLITYLKATFDARAPDIVKDNKYYVPHACAECHGAKITNPDNDGSYAKLKLNYLDTDHWFDRLNDDFAVVKTMPFGVLFDGGKVVADGGDQETTPQFTAAFDVIRRLNTEIREQNAMVEPTPTPVPPSFQLRAVDKWLELHKTSTSHQNVFARALPNPSGTPWSAAITPDKDLLPLLNQYCFRCHSSLKFNIFDRREVVRRASLPLGSTIIDRLHFADVTSKVRMPQDRNLDCAQKWRDDKRRLHELVCQLPGAVCPTPTPPTTPCPTPSPTPP